MTLDQAIKQIQTAIAAAKQRQEFGYFDDEKNIKELLMAIEYGLNPPKKSERKA